MREIRALGEPATAADGQAPGRSGAGRVLVAVYGTFALAAGSRAAVQISTKFHEAPVAYLLSAFAAVVYIVATIALARAGKTWWWVALVACAVEFLGVLSIRTFSVFDTAAFPQATVWSVYGQ